MNQTSGSLLRALRELKRVDEILQERGRAIQRSFMAIVTIH